MDFFIFETPMNLKVVASYAFGIITVLLGCYIHFVYNKWVNAYPGTRVKRSSKYSPSNKQRPDNTKYDDVEARILRNSSQHDALSKCEVQQKNQNESSSVVQEKTRAIPFKGILEKSEKAEQLNMDHVYMRFLDFLWGYLCIGPSVFSLYAIGATVLSIRQYLAKNGILKVKECDVEALVAKLCLEQSQVIHYYAKTKKDNIAGFFFSDFPYVDNDCNFCVADILAVHIDLDAKRFVKAKMDDVNLTAMETLILLWFNTIAAQHVKIHAMANWGVNDDLSLKETNPFLLQNSVVTTFYNYLGFTCFSGLLETLERQGFLSEGWSKKGPLMNCINHGIKEGVGHHGNITELMRYSRFVNFTVKVRAIFFNEFAKHKHLFPGIDGEALFVGTVLHSLDHTFAEWNLADPLWLDIDNEKFGKMAELGRIVRVGFVEDLPFLCFNKRFSGSKHPFYRNVYKKAARIDKELADNMDTCIIK